MSKHTPGQLVAQVMNKLEEYDVEMSDLGMVVAEEIEEQIPIIAAAPEMLKALEYAASLIKVARQYFPKSVKNSDKFQLENTCAAINKAIAKAEGREGEAR